MDAKRVAGKGFAGGFFGLFGSLAGAGGKNIKVGDGDLQTAAEVGTNFLTITGQAIADSVESKKIKQKSR